MTKKLYITTAIPYANAKPHIGNALDYLLADIWKRYQEQLGNTVRFQVGTDEHGNKITTAATARGVTPLEFVNEMHGNFRNLMDKLNTSYTDFVRTTDQSHVATAQYIWRQLEPYIYKGHYEGWYCEGCEAFYTDKEVKETGGVCQDHQREYERVSEENYYLKASAFTDQIREAIQTDQMKVLPSFRKNEVLDLIKDGIKDVSISRPVKSLSWGIQVPGDPTQVMYVWIDALSNYLSVIGYPENTQWSEYWPADIQVVGKDILRFHALIWPVMLLGAGIALPKVLLVHGHISSQGKKISKSIGNVVDPNEVVDTYGLDAFRYYFARHIPTQDDGDFTWEKFENAYNTELGNDFGNLVQRVASMINRYQAGVIGDIKRGEHDVQLYHDAMEALEFDKALDRAWVKVRSVNLYLENVKPWQIAKQREQDPDAEAHLSEVLTNCVGAILQVADILYPFMPDTSKKVRAAFETGVVVDQGVLFPKIHLHTQDPRAPKQPPAPSA